MYKFSKIFCFSLLLLVFTANTFSQESSISKEEFDSVIKKGFESASAKNRRTIQTSVYYSSGEIERQNKTVDEYIVPDKHRYLSISKKGDVETWYESISLKDERYIKENGKDWIRDDDGGGTFLARRVGAKPRIPKYITEYTVNEDKKSKEKVYIKNQLITETGYKDILILDNYLFDENGYLKQITSVVSHSNKDNIFSKTIKTYEYDPKDLKIEAPILSTEEKP